MKTLDTNVAIIGSGTSALNALREVEKAGEEYLLIESGEYGTMCARTGCMPSKLLIAAAEASHSIDQASVLGIHVKEKIVDSTAVFNRVRAERDRFAGIVVKSTEKRPQKYRIHGAAKFIGPTKLQIDDHTIINARTIVIATGSEPFLPKEFEHIKDDVLFSYDVFELKDLPSSLAVIGTGIIGLELGQSLDRLGVETTFFSRSNQVGSFSDPNIGESIFEVLSKELNFQLNSTITNIKKTSTGTILQWENEQGNQQQEFEKILVATGRKSTVPHLNTEAAGFSFEQVNERWNEQTTQIGDLPIFIAGDAVGHKQILHEASDEGRIAGKNAVNFPDSIAQVRRTPLSIIFTDPQIASVGKRYDELDLNTCEVGEASFDDQGRARVVNQNRGLIRIYAERQNCQLIGAEIFAPRAENLAHLLAWAIQQKLTVQQAIEMPVYHPVLEEGMRTALRNLLGNLKLSGNCRCIDLAEAPCA